jgi:hypothetical protein
MVLLDPRECMLLYLVSFPDMHSLIVQASGWP